MLSIFALRLALGLILSLLLLSPRQVEPRFYRMHFLISLGLGALAASFLWSQSDGNLRWALVIILIVGFVGSLVWSIEGTPGGRILNVLMTLALGAGLWLVPIPEKVNPVTAQVNHLLSALVIGLATSAMLLGHSYLIAPTMSITPLIRLCIAFFIVIALRTVFASLMLWHWLDDQSAVKMTDVTILWLPLRWATGILGPVALGVMAYQSAKIRSTQSATGILYVLVIFCYVGELTSQLLLSETKLAL